MIRVRQVELDTLTFSQYDNSISEIIFHKNSSDAIERFFHFVNMVIKETHPNNTIYFLCDLTDAKNLTLKDYYTQIAKINANYDLLERPKLRFANLYPSVKLKHKLILEFIRSIDTPNVELDMFSIEERNRAIAWLLSV